MDKLIQTETRGCGQVPLVNSLHAGYFFMLLMYLLSFVIFFLQNILSGTLSECQIVWVQIRSKLFVNVIRNSR